MRRFPGVRERPSRRIGRRRSGVARARCSNRARARSGWPTASMAMPRLPTMSLSRADIAELAGDRQGLFQSSRSRAWALPSFKCDRAQVGERRGFLVAIAGLARGGQDRFGMRRGDSSVATASALGWTGARGRPRDSSPETRKGFRPASGCALAAGQRDLMPSLVEQLSRSVRARPGSGRFVVRRIVRRMRRREAESPRCRFGRGRRLQSWPTRPPTRCRARIEVAAVVHRP